jgi:hypothetical protein
MSIDISSSRALLTSIAPAVRETGKRINKDAWVWCAGRHHWEFHGPNNYYWHGHAGNAYEARFKGWSAWLESTEQQA